MHLRTKNVNSAFRDLVHYLSSERLPESVTLDRDFDLIINPAKPVEKDSRNGPVRTVEGPMLVTYEKPLERVLFNTARDANPFLHLYEALWMLAGRNDVNPLAYYCERMRGFSDDGITLNGAYGYRWRHARFNIGSTTKLGYGKTDFDVGHVDQLDEIVEHLQNNPHSRRAVLQMWNVEDDLLKTDTSKDICCNLSVMFSVRNLLDNCQVSQSGGHMFNGTFGDGKPMVCLYCGIEALKPALDMTVTNRSNDLLWGLLGTNYVHFSILQEYMAARLGVDVGLYHHFTNNLHVYKDRGDWKPDQFLECETGESRRRYHPDLKLVPLVKDIDTFHLELPLIVKRYSGEQYTMGGAYSEPFFMTVAQPMFLAWQRYKQSRNQGCDGEPTSINNAVTRMYMNGALEAAGSIQSDDWGIACLQWLEKRLK